MAATNLTAADLTMFAKLGVTVELLVLAGVRRVSDDVARVDFGFNSTGDNSGVVFPYHDPRTGYRVTARLRRDHPEVEIEDGKEHPKNKYTVPALDKRHLYFPPGSKALLDEQAVPVVLVEAEKSALALLAWSERLGRRLLPVALGGVWSWRGKIGKAETADGKGTAEVGPLADLDLCARDREVGILFDTNVRTNWNVRAARLALVEQLRTMNATVKVLNLPIIEGVNGPDDLLATQGDTAMEKVFAAPPESEINSPPFSEDWLALRLVSAYGENLRYTASTGRWHIWTEKIWEEDSIQRVLDLSREVCRTASLEMDAIKPGKGRSLASSKVVTATERLARADMRIAVAADEWDAHSMLLGCQNGIVDLRTGELLPHDRKLLMSKITGTELAPMGTHAPLWSSFLKRITNGDIDLENFLQRVAGYACTGDTGEQCLFFCYGCGANGKSVFLTTLASVLGDHARTASMETFLASAMSQHPTDLAALQGARLVSSTETERGRRWDESKIKSLTGGDRIAARYMRQDFFEFTPQFKLIIAGNHKPRLRSVDEAIRRRMHLVPFVITIPKSERDPELKAKLQKEWPAILRWAIDGCLQWQAQGLNPPAAVNDATAAYLSDENAVERWVESNCELVPGQFTSTRALYADWKEWAEAAGTFVGSDIGFSENLELIEGVRRKRTSSVRGFEGISLKPYNQRPRYELPQDPDYLKKPMGEH
jgi:putative DNA primase/helicase